MKKLSIFLSGMLLFFGVLGVANATLWDRGGGLLYDDVLDITWLQNANYAATEVNETRAQEIIDAVGSIDDHILTLADFHDYDSAGGSYNGKMSWYGSLAWADQLVYGGYDDWRLPKGGNQIGGGELGHMYYENLPLYSSLIYNLVENYYWSSDEYYPYPPDTDTPYAFMFYFDTQSNVHERIFTFKDNVVWAWAVRDGDVLQPPELVNIDIIPKKCPNECKIKGGGFIKVAILGSVDLDVDDIDIASVRLEGVPPTKSSLKDKSTPVSNPVDECDCTTEGKDGFIDLCLKFDKKAIITAIETELGGVVDLDIEYPLTLTGNKNDGTPIEGQDCIVFVKKGKKD